MLNIARPPLSAFNLIPLRFQVDSQSFQVPALNFNRILLYRSTCPARGLKRREQCGKIVIFGGKASNHRHHLASLAFLHSKSRRLLPGLQICGRFRFGWRTFALFFQPSTAVTFRGPVKLCASEKSSHFFSEQQWQGVKISREALRLEQFTYCRERHWLAGVAKLQLTNAPRGHKSA